MHLHLMHSCGHQISSFQNFYNHLIATQPSLSATIFHFQTKIHMCKAKLDNLVATQASGVPPSTSQNILSLSNDLLLLTKSFLLTSRVHQPTHHQPPSAPPLPTLSLIFSSSPTLNHSTLPVCLPTLQPSNQPADHSLPQHALLQKPAPQLQQQQKLKPLLPTCQPLRPPPRHATTAAACSSSTYARTSTNTATLPANPSLPTFPHPILLIPLPTRPSACTSFSFSPANPNPSQI